MQYKRVNWKDYPEEDTPTSAENLNTMDKGIKDISDVIGDNDISLIGDGTVTGALGALQEEQESLNESILQMMEWKELGILRKGNTLTLPSDFNELEIAIYTTNSSHAAVMRISKKNIDRLDFLSTCMWSQSNTDNYNYRFSIKNNEISLNAAKTGSTDITSSTNAHVLYR